MKNHLLKIHFPAFIIILTFLFQFFITKELWISDKRDLPPFPFFDFLPVSFGKTVDTLFLLMMFSSFFFLIYKPENKKFLLLFFIPAFLLVLEDTIRLQPWFYLHLVMTGIIAFEKEISRENVIRLLQWIVIAIYFWGGFNKLNTAFAWEIFPWFTQPMGIGEDYFLGMDNLHSFPLPPENKIAFIIPAFEMMLAFLLFFPFTRIIGIAGVITTHLISLYAIGPWGHNWNQIVWPWNMEMIFLTIILFRKKEKINLAGYLKNHWHLIKTKTGAVILFLFLLAPAFGFLGYWDKALSIHLYSGNSDDLEFYFDGYEENFAGTSLEQHLYLDTISMKSMMKVEYWAIEQTAVPMYNSPRYFKKIGKHLCDCLDKPETGGINILTRSGFGSTQDTIRIPCKDL